MPETSGRNETDFRKDQGLLTFRRFLLRGKEKGKTKWGPPAISAKKILPLIYPWAEPQRFFCPCKVPLFLCSPIAFLFLTCYNHFTLYDTYYKYDILLY